MSVTATIDQLVYRFKAAGEADPLRLRLTAADTDALLAEMLRHPWFDRLGNPSPPPARPQQLLGAIYRGLTIKEVTADQTEVW